MALAPGTRFGPYEVLGPLGAGGMGEVYRARDTRLSRDAALKILPADVHLDAQRLARFEREARTLAALSHPNIATLYSFEEVGGTRALAMELVDGQSLSDHLSRPDRRAGVPLAEAVSIATQLAVALDAAHEHGIIHRDLKPGNVMIRPDGSIKVLDFGLATRAPEAESPAISSSTLTGAGMVVGTPAYMSPEQARGYQVDRRTDIWAFGCVFFELLSGRRAFEGQTASDVVAAVLEHDPDWSQLPASTPSSVRRLLERCLVKDPRRRLRDIGDALHDLESAAPGAHGSAAAAPSPRTWRLAAALVAVALAATGAWMAWRPAPAPAPTVPAHFELAFPQHAPLGAAGGVDLGQLAISPDGSRIVYPTPRGLAVRTRDQLDVTFLDLPGENVNSPFFSPDGRWIGYTTPGATLRKVAVNGGPSVFVADTGNAAIGAWGPDSIVYTDQQGMFRVSQDGGRPTMVPLDLADHEQPTFPEVLPGGRAVLFTVIATRSNTPTVSAVDPGSRIDAVDLVTGRRITVVRGGGHQRYLRSGHLVFGAAGSIRAVAFDPQTLEVRGAPVEVLRDSGSAYFEAADDGTLIYMRGGDTGTVATLVWVDREGREEPLGAPPMSYIYPRLSPDGRRVALDVVGPNRDIYIWDIARRVLERFTTDPAEDAVVRWTRDGAKIAFANSRHGVPNVFWQAADGSGAPERLFESPVLQHPMSFGPDGTLVVSELSPGRGRGAKVLTLAKPRRMRPLLEDAINLELSPDGRWLAYASSQSGQFEVYVTSYPNARGRWQISTGGARQPAWSPDGKELFYRDFAGALVSVPVTLAPTFTAGQGRKLFENSAYRGAGTGISDRTYDVTPDGRRFVMIRATEPPQRTLAVVQHWVDDLSRRVPTK